MLPIRTVLHATDFTECSDVAFRVACSLAHDYGAHLIVLNVAPRWSTRHPGELEELLHRCQLPDLNVRMEHLLAEGSPAHEVLRVAHEKGCDLIVVGTHRGGGDCRGVLSSVSDAIIQGAECPVLVVKFPHKTGPSIEAGDARTATVAAGDAP